MGLHTPILNLPYPVGTDRVMDGDNAIQALAESVEASTAEAIGLRLNGTFVTQSGVWATVTNWMDDPAMPRVGAISSSGGALVVARTGIYSVMGAVTAAANPNGIRQVSVDTADTVSGIATISVQVSATPTAAGQTIVASGILYARAGQFIRLQAYQSSGAAMTWPVYPVCRLAATILTPMP